MLRTISFDNEDLVRGIKILDTDQVSSLLKNGGKIHAAMNEKETILSVVVSESGSDRYVEIAKIENSLLEKICAYDFYTAHHFVEGLTGSGFRYRGESPVIPTNPADVEILTKLLTCILTLSYESLITSCHSFEEKIGVGNYKKPLRDVISNVRELVDGGAFGITDLIENGIIVKICSDHDINEQQLIEYLKPKPAAPTTKQTNDTSMFGAIDGFLSGLSAMSDRFVQGTAVLSDRLISSLDPSANKSTDTAVTNSGHRIPIEAFVIKTDRRGSENKSSHRATLVIPNEGKKESDRTNPSSRTAGSRINQGPSAGAQLRRSSDPNEKINDMQRPACNRNQHTSRMRGNIIL